MNGASFHAAEFLDRLTEITQANLTNSQFGVSELAREIGMSRSNLHLRVKKLTNKSVSQFINQVRLKKAIIILKQGSLTISETAFDCGFQSVSYFTKCFHDCYGYPPGETHKHLETKEVEVYPDNKTIHYKTWSMLIIVAMAILIPVTLASYYFFITNKFPSRSVEVGYSIAVLPFIYESTDTTNEYFISGLMETILNDLSNISELNVRSRTTVEKYRNNELLSLSEIARELKVNFIVEGSGQKYGDMVVLTIALLDANTDNYLFSKQYEQEIKNMNDFVGLHSRIALDLVSNLKTTINPEDNKTIKPEEIKNIPTESIEALHYYFQGIEIHRSAAGNENQIKLELQAKTKFEKALEMDPTFVLPMVQLGWIFITLNKTVDTEKNYLDSAFYYATRAIKYDNKTAAPFELMGFLYLQKGDYDKALKNYQSSLLYSDNNKHLGLYRNMGMIYFQNGDYLKGIDYTYKQLQIELQDGQNINYWTLQSLYHMLRMLGYFEESKKYSTFILNKNNDSVGYYERMMHIHFTFGNYDSVIRIGEQRFEKDSSSLSWELPWAWLAKKNFPEATKWFHYYNEVLKRQEKPYEDSFGKYGLSFIYFLNGETEKAIPLFNQAIQLFKYQIENNLWPEGNIPHVFLASVYSTLGEKENALKSLRNNESTHLFTLTTLKLSPLFDNIRNEPEFQKIVEEMEIKYQKHHKQVGKLLHEQGEIK